MKKALIMAAAAIMAIAATSCIIEKRPASDRATADAEAIVMAIKAEKFSSVNVGGAVTLILTQGETDSIRLDGDAKDVARYTVKQDGDKLFIRQKDNITFLNKMSSSGKVTVYASTPDLSHIEAAGACSIIMDKPVSFNSLSILVSGATDIDIDSITVNTLKIRSSGASDIDIDHATVKDEFVSQLTGAGALEACVVGAENVSVNAAGAGSCEIRLKDCGDVVCSMSGAASADISGNARSISKDKSGAASIDTDDLKLGK